jgi:hypothetical protein
MRVTILELAKELAPAFAKASWGDIEDDASLCEWVRKQSGEEMTLKQAEDLRSKVRAVIDKFPKVVIYVEGGVVTGCTSNDERLRVFIVDRDDIKEEDDPPTAEEEATTGAEDCTFDVY